MAELRGFFFDLDGTLVDTHDANYRAYQQAADDVTSVVLGPELKTYIATGKSSDEFLTSLLPGSHHAAIPEINARKKQIYAQYMEHSRLNRFLADFLQHVARDAQTVLVTTAKQANAQAVLRHHDLERHFTHFIFGDDVSRMKPDPEAYERALELSGLAAREAVAFEDSETGLEAAAAAGIATIRIRDF